MNRLPFLLISLMISYSSLQASMNFYNDISLFPTTTDSVNWANAGAVFDQLNNPFTISSQLGNLLTVSKPLDSYQIIQQMSDGSGGWTGIFNEGDYLLNTNYTASNGGWFGPITINFNNPISAFSTQLEPDIGWGTSTMAHLDVYDINNNLLGSNSQAAFASNLLGMGYYIPPAFFGVTSTGYDIAKVVLSIDENTDFSINGLSLNSNALATPEPSTYLFLGSTLGLLSLAMYKKRRTVV